MLGPKEKLSISSRYGKGSKFSFIIFKNKKNSSQLSFKKFNHSEKSFSAIRNISELSLKKRIYSSKFKTSENFEIIDNSFLKTEEFSSKNGDCLSFSSWNSEVMNLDDIFSENEEKKKKTNLYKFTIFCEKKISDISSKKNKFKLKKKNYANLLIVDDNMFNILILENFIEKIDICPINTIRAFDGSTACDIFNERNKSEGVNNIDIIIMDTEMPIMNGYNASKNIKNKIIDENFVNCFIISYSGNQDVDNITIAIENGMDGHLNKPTTQEIFKNYLSDVLVKMIYHESSKISLNFE